MDMSLCGFCFPCKRDLPYKDEFDWGYILGKGSFGEVFKCTRKKDEKIMACKVMKIPSDDESEKKYLSTEIQMMKKLSDKHPAFLTTYEWRKIIEPPNTIFYLFVELCEGGDLSQCGKLKEHEFKFVLEEITSALAYLHSRRISHLDLKPQNIAFIHKSSLEIKLLDFGVALRRSEGRYTSKYAVGTRFYMAPEVAKNTGFTEAADMWSLGVMAFELLTGERFIAFGDLIFEEEFLKKRVDKMFPGQQYDQYSDKAKDLIKHLIVIQPTERLTAEETLNHGYFQNYHNENIIKRFEYYARRGELQNAFHPKMVEWCKGKSAYAKSMFKEMKDLDFKKFKKIWEKREERLARRFSRSASLSASLSSTGSTTASSASTEEEDDDDGRTSVTDLIGKEHEGWRIVFNSLDRNGNGKISQQDLMDWIAYDYVMNSDERLWEFVETIDIEKDGKITKKKCERALKGRKHDIDWEEYFDEYPSHNYQDFGMLFRLDTAPKIFSELTSEIETSWSHFDVDDSRYQ